MSSLQDILLILLALEFLIITACIVFVSYFLFKAIRSITDASEIIKEKLQMKAISFIPALLIAIISRIITRRR